MERLRNNPDFSHDEEFAKYLYDNVDWVFTRRGIPSGFEDSFDSRHSTLELSDDELQYIAVALESYAIDAPHFLEITLDGRNPYIYTAIPHGSVLITMKHFDHEQNEIVSTYTVVLDSSADDPVIVHKDVTRNVLTYKREAYEAETIPFDMDLVDCYHKEAPVTRDERRGLDALIKIL